MLPERPANRLSRKVASATLSLISFSLGPGSLHDLNLGSRKATLHHTGPPPLPPWVQLFLGRVNFSSIVSLLGVNGFVSSFSSLLVIWLLLLLLLGGLLLLLLLPTLRCLPTFRPPPFSQVALPGLSTFATGDS